jgi:hypothetical protein
MAGRALSPGPGGIGPGREKMTATGTHPSPTAWPPASAATAAGHAVILGENRYDAAPSSAASLEVA